MSSIDPSRRAFLRGDIHNKTSRRNPPWTTTDFVDLCQRCDECITTCEQKILVRGDGGFPEVDFRRGECTFCGACARACRHDAIADTNQPAWHLKAHINPACLEHQGITCRACGECCEARAIRFFPRLGGGAELRLDQQTCTGCGACVAVCPVSAVTMGPASTHPTPAPTAAQTNPAEERA